MRLAVRVALVAWLTGTPAWGRAQIPTTVQCGDSARPRRHCTAELTSVQQRFAPLEQQLATAVARDGSLALLQDALASLKLRRQQLCHDWNACSVDEVRHRTTITWIEHELGSLSQLLSSGANAAALRGWATELNVHAGAVDMARGAALRGGQMAVPRPRATPVILQSLAHLERLVADLERLRQVLPRVGRALAIPQRDRAPRICRERSSVRRDLRALVQGDNSSVSNGANSVLRVVDRLCQNFARWLQPDEGTLSSIRRFFARLDRIDGWMADIDRCAGDYNRACRNTFGERGASDVEQSREVRSVTREVRRALTGVPSRRPFPCRAPIWARLENSQWIHSTARAQVPSVGQRARALCRRLRVDEGHVSELVQRIDNRVELLLVQNAERIQGHQNEIRRLRATFAMPEGR